MRDYIEERAVEIANYIIEEKATVRQTAKKFGISIKSLLLETLFLEFELFYRFC